MKIETLESRTLLASSISGFIYNDVNANGLRDAGENGIRNTKVYLDLNNDGKKQKAEPVLKASKTGGYTFENLDAGTYTVRAIHPKKHRITAPDGGSFTIVANGNDIHAAIDFGVTKTSRVSGTVFNDLNSSQTHDGGESVIPGVLVFLDKNNNGVWDSSNEQARVTNDDGNYVFESVPTRKYNLRVALPDDATATTPNDGVYKLKLKPGQTVTGKHFGLI